ncbi:fucose permease [Colletotrichum orchidophilum]|uniref:Fucose permease n=1 Tax=Colletotrichum orchidophilum TaxID=1209926 RepID=A0A1G4B1S3_9PEZI|nr:fucose permease [Colletotrichum orchidophilum]OHE95344.1 fucose permease [Colletotrichum orchidophilum]
MSSADAADDSIPDRGPAVFAVTAATFVLASVMVAARLFCRRWIVRNVSWDDKIMFFAWMIAFGLSFTICFGTRKGLGRFDENIPSGHWNSLRECEYVFSILYNPALMATKTSILIFYLRLSKNTKKVLRFASWVTLGIVNLAGTVLTLINIFQCRPVQAAWEIWRDTSQCIPLLTEFICSAPINIVTDLAILALPIPVLTGMRLPPRQKIILVLTFTIGIFVTIVDVVRIYYLQQAVSSVPTGGISSDPSSHFGGTPDFAWNSSLSFMWSAVEVNVGMACACIPTLKPLIIKILPAMIIDPDGTRSSTQTEKDILDSPRNRTGSDGLVSPTNPNDRGSVNIQEPPATLRASRDMNGASNTDEYDMTALEFLTTPDMTLAEYEATGAGRIGGVPNRASIATSRENTIYFGFVNMKRPKSMVKCDAQESLRYCLVVTILFLMWGISYGLLNTLNNVISGVSGMTVAQTLGLTTAYFGGGYFFGPLLVGEWILRRDEHHRRNRKNNKRDAESVGGFKVTFIVGLCFYGVGTIIFWPSAVTKSWGGFLLSNFVVGFGLSVLETGANAFLILCGPPEFGETRLLLAQGIQGVGSVLSGLMAQRVFFTKITNQGGSDSVTLLNVQWTYLAITLLCVALGLFFYYMPLPELNDNELQESADRLPVNPQKRSIGGLQLRTWSLILAVLAQWTYVACQESNNIFFRALAIAILPDREDGGTAATNADTSPGENSDKPPGLTIGVTDYHLIAHSAFAISRFIVAYLTYLSVRNPRMPKPRTWLAISVGLSILFALLTVVLQPSDPNLLMIAVILFYFAEGPVWPLIFAIGLRGQGRRTKRAAAFITMGGSGAAFFPYIIYAVINTGVSVQLSFVIIVALFVLTGFYPIWLAFVRDAKTMTDPAHSYISPEERVSGEDEIDINRQLRRRRRTLSTIAAKSKRGSIFSKIPHLGRTNGESVTPPAVEHSEEKNDSTKGSEGSNDTHQSLIV